MTLKEKYLELAFAKISSEELRDESVQVAEDFAIGFAEWCIKWRVEFVDDTVVGVLYNYGGMYQTYTIKELLEIYKQEKEL
jgi:hypothetical protein